MKKTIMNLVLLLIAVCAFAQAPEWQWATQAGGSSGEVGYGIAIDDAGNTYVTGRFEGTATFGSYSLTSSGDKDVFVAKMDAVGNWLWATKASGNSEDNGDGITIDDAGNSYVTGYFVGTASFGSYSLTSNGESDIFVAKIDVTGNWQWATKAGGTSHDDGEAITIDDAGNCYVIGDFYETSTFGSYSLTSSGECDIFIAKMDTGGNWLWTTKAGGSSYDGGYGITIDDAGNTYVTGYFMGTANFGSNSLTSSGQTDIFVAKMDTDGNWQWATKAGGISCDRASEIVMDDAGNTYVTGDFEDTATFGSYSLTSNGCEDIFVAKMDADGNWLWATKAGGSVYDRGYAITIDDAENTYVTGLFEGEATFGSYSLTSSGEYDIFVAKLNSSVFAEDEIIPTINSLSNYPNPFNPSTTISFFVTQTSSFVTLDIYNIKGQKVKQLVSNQLTSGEHSIIWNGKDMNKESVSSGIYFYKLSTKDKTFIKKMILLR